MNLNILITGAGGFIGKNLSEYLVANGYNVFSANHKELELLDKESVENYLEKNKINFIVHCAATGGSRLTGYDKDKNDVADANLQMFKNLKSCMTPEMRMISFGSGAEYDKSRPLAKISEADFGESVPQDDYGYAKYQISKLIDETDNITCLRIFGLYGKYEDYRFKFISNAIVKNLLKMPIAINQNVVFDYLYIDDFLKIVETFIKNPPKEKCLNIAPTESIDLVKIAETINEISELKSEIIVKNQNLNNEYTASNERLLEELGDAFKFASYKEGIEKLYNYYKNNLDNLDLECVKKDEYIKHCKTKGKNNVKI